MGCENGAAGEAGSQSNGNEVKLVDDVDDVNGRLACKFEMDCEGVIHSNVGVDGGACEERR